MQSFQNKDGKEILLKMVQTIQQHKEYLSKIDGSVGDGDHGMNMNKGFTLFQNKYEKLDYSFTQGLGYLAMVLLNEIGSSMGPIYGTIFGTMAETSKSWEIIGISEFSLMLRKAREELFTIVDAREGDKTLVDTFSPAVDSVEKAVKENKTFQEALIDMCIASENGKNKTKEMVAKYGRAARLGERSRGVLDAGAVSCNLLLNAMAEGIQKLL